MGIYFYHWVAGAGGEGPILTRLTNIASEIGFYKLATVGKNGKLYILLTTSDTVDLVTQQVWVLVA